MTPSSTFTEALMRLCASPEFQKGASVLVDLWLDQQVNPPPKQPRMLTPFSVLGRGLDGATRFLLGDWSPDPLHDEKAYHDSAEAFIKSRAPGAVIHRNPRHNGGRPDLTITWSGFFTGASAILELKAHIRSTSECDRLVGQVVRYQAGDNSVLVVLCGNTRRHHVQAIQARLKAQAHSLFDNGRIIVVDRTTTTISETRIRERLQEQESRSSALKLRDLRRRERAEM